MIGRRAFDAYAQASGSGLEWGILNADEQARWVAVERACMPTLAERATKALYSTPRSMSAFTEAILDASYETLPAGVRALVTRHTDPLLLPSEVFVIVKHCP